jgi:hypothetical protein
MPTIPPTPPEHGTHHAAAHPTSTPLLYSGLFLIVLAVLLLIMTSWNSFSPASRIITTSLPVLLLYILAHQNRQRPTNVNLSKAASFTASLLFPFALGVIIYQSGLYRPEDAPLNATLVFLISLVSLIWFAILEFIRDKPWLAPLTIVATCTVALSVGGLLELPSYMFYLFGIIVGYFLLSVGWTLQHVRKLREATLFTYCGAIIGIISLLLFPSSYFQGVFGPSLSLTYAGLAIILFLVAIVYSIEWTREPYEPFMFVRKIAENGAAITLTLPALLNCLSTDSVINALIALLFGAIALLVSKRVHVPAFKTLGAIAAIVAVGKVLVLSFILAGSLWIYVLLLAGFTLIGLAINTGHAHVRTTLASILSPSPTSLFGLGYYPSAHREQYRSTPRGISVLKGFGIIIGIYILLTLSIGTF